MINFDTLQLSELDWIINIIQTAMNMLWTLTKFAVLKKITLRGSHPLPLLISVDDGGQHEDNSLKVQASAPRFNHFIRGP